MADDDIPAPVDLDHDENALQHQVPVQNPDQNQAPRQGRFVMKGLEPDYQTLEKDRPHHTAAVEGRQSEIHPKTWRLDDHNSKLPPGSTPLNMEEFEVLPETPGTIYFGDVEREYAKVSYTPITPEQQIQAEFAAVDALNKIESDAIKARKDAALRRHEAPAHEIQKMEPYPKNLDPKPNVSIHQTITRNVVIGGSGGGAAGYNNDAPTQEVTEPVNLDNTHTHLFVMDGEGEVYTHDDTKQNRKEDVSKRAADIHHSSFLKGEPVAGAGELKLGQQGELKEMTDRSGHYKPGDKQNEQTLNELESKGVNLDNVRFTRDRMPTQVKHNNKVTGMANEYLQGTVPDNPRATPQNPWHGASEQARSGDAPTPKLNDLDRPTPPDVDGVVPQRPFRESAMIPSDPVPLGEVKDPGQEQPGHRQFEGVPAVESEPLMAGEEVLIIPDKAKVDSVRDMMAKRSKATTMGTFENRHQVVDDVKAAAATLDNPAAVEDGSATIKPSSVKESMKGKLGNTSSSSSSQDVKSGFGF